MAVQGINLCWIVVADLQSALDYYQGILGMTVLENVPEFGWAELSGPTGARLGLAQANPEMDMAPGSNAVFTLSVTDLQQSCKEFALKGVLLLGDIMEVPGHVRLQLCEDADGNQFQLVQELDSPL